MKTVSGIKYLFLALLSFCAYKLGWLLELQIFPKIYGADLLALSDSQRIISLIVTCLLWGESCILLSKLARKMCGYELFAIRDSARAWQWLMLTALVIISLIISYQINEGIKIIKNYWALGAFRFVFQCIFDVFRVMPIMLALIFLQEALELWTRSESFLLCAVAAGVIYGGTDFYFTRNVTSALLGLYAGFAAGSVYPLTNRNVRAAYPMLWMLLVL